jgi:hypothetical protein
VGLHNVRQNLLDPENRSTYPSGKEILYTHSVATVCFQKAEIPESKKSHCLLFCKMN